MANPLPIYDEHKARMCDEGEKNKFRFDWLNKVVEIDKDLKKSVGETVKKVNISGKALCELCSDLINYGSKGFISISNHMKTKKHVNKVRQISLNYTLPSNFFGKSASTVQHNSANSGSSNSTAVQMPVNVPLCDRVTNAQCLVLGVIAEHNLPFTMSPVLIELSKVLASDKKALNQLNMARTTASYKMRLGLAKTFTEDITENLRNHKFSLNIDEATSSNFKRVVSILASYFSTIDNRVVVQHLASVSITRVCSETLFNEILKLFETHNIPWNNLMSVLMDSCNVMRGSKSGLEVRIREKASHLLDVDGDSCHHIHNAAKKFCKPFDGHIQKYLTDIYKDFKWSADQKEGLVEICLILGVKFTSVDNMIPHRWLSCYDVSLNNLRIFDALTILYYAFLSASDKTIYFSTLCAIYQEKCVSSEGRAKIKEIHKYLMGKSLTSEGKARKTRIVQKLFYERKKTKLILYFYIAALPLLKKYVCLFQTKEPMVHKLHDEQEQLFLNFLACFLKPEVLKDKSVKQLIDLDISLEENRLKKTKMFLGSSAESTIIKDSKNVTVVAFLEQASQAYIQCASYLQKKLPLNNPLLKCISAIDPVARGHSITLDCLKKLPKLVKNVLLEEEESQYCVDVYLYQVDKSLPSHHDEAGNVLPIDVWWAEIFKLHKFSALSKMVKALLSCFHGPQVESSFSMMGDVLDKESSNMSIKTFSAIQTIKYKLQSQNKSALEFFKKNNYLHDPVDKDLCQNMKTSYSEYKKEVQQKEEEMDRKRNELNISKNLCSKIKSNELVKKKENCSRLIHKRKLEQLVRKKNLKKIKLQQ